jgi:phenylalanyl-tRNA synthetase alpha chain
MKMIDKIKEYIGEAQAFSTQDKAELEAFRIKFLGSKGLLKDSLPSSRMFLMTKKEFGQVINLLKSSAEESKKHSGNFGNKKKKGFYDLRVLLNR